MDGRIAGYEDPVRIGSGGSSTVYRAVDVRHRRPVAIKVLNVEATGRTRRAFTREIEAIGRVGSHPYVVTVLASGFTADDHPYIVLPFFERGTYGDMIDEHGPLTWAAAVDVGIKLCSAVETVHRAGVVHRDIKPGNVFIGVTPEHPLLADFGISSTIDSEPTRTDTMAVTFGYTAPEVLDDERPTPASDIYSLAMTIYRLIQGLHAYHAETPAAVMRKVLSDPDRPRLSAGVPPGVAAAVIDGLSKEPAGRPDSALALARRLQAVQIDQGLAPTPVVVADEPAVEMPRVEVPADAATVQAALVEAALVDALDRGRQPEVRPPPPQHRRFEQLDLRPPEIERHDVGRILAEAIKEAGVSPAVVDGDDAHPASAHQVDPALDLPTIVTPRRPREGREEAGVAQATGRTRWWLVVGAVAAILAAAAVVAFVLTL